LTLLLDNKTGYKNRWVEQLVVVDLFSWSGPMARQYRLKAFKSKLRGRWHSKVIVMDFC